MKIVVLNGSPKKAGTVAQLLQAVVAGLDPRIEVEWVNVYSLAMQSCAGCMHCRSMGSCALPEDDAHRTGRLIAGADGLIVGTPTYWGNMSSQLKLFLDRNVPLFIEGRSNRLPLPKQKGKPAIIVTACSTPYPLNFILRESRGAIGAVKKVLRSGGYRLIGCAVRPGSKDQPDINDRLKRRAHRLGQRFSQAIIR